MMDKHNVKVSSTMLHDLSKYKLMEVLNNYKRKKSSRYDEEGKGYLMIIIFSKKLLYVLFF